MTERHLGWTLLAILAFLCGALAVVLLYEVDVFGGATKTTTEGSGVSATQVRHVAAFHSIQLAGSNNIVIGVGKPQSVVVKADKNLLDRVTTKVESGELVVGNTSGSFTTKSPMSVAVTVPTVTALTLSGSGNLVVKGVKAENLVVRLPGSGTLTGTGTATRLDVAIDGSGSVIFTALVAGDVRAAVDGSGSIFVTATRSLDGSVAGSGSILYTGSPQKVTKNVAGSGAIIGG